MANRKSKAVVSVEALLNHHSPEIRAVTERLRAIVRAVAPEATESAQASWHSLNYHHPNSGYFCGIFPKTESVMLVFEFGILLADPDGVLEGDGKQVRYIILRRDQDIHVRSLKRLLHAALNLPAARSVKLELVRAQARFVSSTS